MIKYLVVVVVFAALAFAGGLAFGMARFRSSRYRVVHGLLTAMLAAFVVTLLLGAMLVPLAVFYGGR